MCTQSSTVDRCAWIRGIEKRTNSVSVSLFCNSLEMVCIQFQNTGGTSQREGYKKHRRLLK